MNRGFVRRTSDNLLIGLLSFIVLMSCEYNQVKNSNHDVNQTPPHEKENLLIGSWEAEWNTNADAFSLDIKQEKLFMKGKIHFEENGLVKIHAYGYDGCIFMSDTIVNELHYIVMGDTINLISDDEKFGLPYQIREAEHNMVKLVLMDDIELTLTR